MYRHILLSLTTFDYNPYCLDPLNLLNASFDVCFVARSHSWNYWYSHLVLLSMVFFATKSCLKMFASSTASHVISGRGTYSYPVKQESNPTPWDRNDTYPVGQEPTDPTDPTHQCVISPSSARRSYSDLVPVESPVEYPDLDNFRRRLILSGIFESCFQLMIAKTVKMQRSFRKLKPWPRSHAFFLSKIDHVYKNNELYMIRYVSKHHSWCNDTWKAIHT